MKKIIGVLAMAMLLTGMLVAPSLGQSGGNFYFAGEIVLKNSQKIDLGDPNDKDKWSGLHGQNVPIPGYEWLGDGENEGPDFHLSCSATLVGTEVRVVASETIHEIVAFSIYRDNKQNATEPLTLRCTEATFNGGNGPTQSIVFVKSWTGDDFGGPELDIGVTFTVSIDGEEVTLGNGEPSEPFPSDAPWDLVRENVTGFPEDACSYTTNVGSTTVDPDGNLLTVVANDVTCENGGPGNGETEAPEETPEESPETPEETPEEAPAEETPEEVPAEETPVEEPVEEEEEPITEVVRDVPTLPATGNSGLFVTLAVLLIVGGGIALAATRAQE